MRITIDAWECEKCHHRWIAESDEPPKRCAKCKARKWHTPDAIYRAEYLMQENVRLTERLEANRIPNQCVHPAKDRVGDNCLNCNQKWR